MNGRMRGLGALAATILVMATAACGDQDALKEGAVDADLAGLPALPEDYLEVPYTGEEPGQSTDRGDRRITLPGQTVTIDSVTTVSTVVDPGTDEESRAADGEQFLVVSMSSAFDETYPYTAPEAQVMIEDNGATTEVLPEIGGGEPFLVSASDDATLAVVSDGRSFEVPLAQDAAETDPVGELLARPGARQDLARPLSFEPASVSAKDGDSSSKYSTTVDSVQLTPYLPAELADGAGRWASEGRAFLVISTSGDEASSDISGYAEWGINTSLQAWTATIDGREHPANADVVFGDDENTTTVIEVPVSTRSAELEVSARSVAEVYATGEVVDLDHGSQSLSVTFG